MCLLNTKTLSQHTGSEAATWAACMTTGSCEAPLRVGFPLCYVHSYPSQSLTTHSEVFNVHWRSTGMLLLLLLMVVVALIMLLELINIVFWRGNVSISVILLSLELLSILLMGLVMVRIIQMPCQKTKMSIMVEQKQENIIILHQLKQRCFLCGSRPSMRFFFFSVRETRTTVCELR